MTKDPECGQAGAVAGGPGNGRGDPSCFCGGVACSRRGLVWAWRRGVGLCVLLVAASFSVFLVTSSERSGFYTRVILSFNHAPEYIMDIMVPSANASPPHAPAIHSTPRDTSNGEKESDDEKDQRGFLVHTSGCIIPDFDPFHHTITRFVSNTIALTCTNHPALTSANGTTLYYYPEVLREHFDFFLKKYKTDLTSTESSIESSPSSASSSSLTASQTTTPHQSAASSAPYVSVETKKVDDKVNARVDGNVYFDFATNTSSDLSSENDIDENDVQCCYRAIYRVAQKPNLYNGAADGRWRYSTWCNPLEGENTTIHEDAILVFCNVSNIVIYKNVHYFIQREKALHRIAEMSKNHNKTTNEKQSASLNERDGRSNKSQSGESQNKIQNSSSQNKILKDGSKDKNGADSSQTKKQSNGKDRSNENSESESQDQSKSNNSPTQTSDRSPNQIDSSSTESTSEKASQDEEQLSVIIFGTDSASRLNMRRHLPKTYRYLTEELGAVDLGGFNKVGDNTFPNLVPVLIGLSAIELSKHKCVPKKEKFDDCPWIWNEFKKKGYATAYMEDSPWMGIFNYMHNGFVIQPTDYYGRAFFLASEKEIGREKHGNSNFCQGPKKSLQVVHDYSLAFARTFPDVPSFSLYWSASVSHDNLNMLRHADVPHLEYLRQLRESGTLNRTALFFLSDHGMRWGTIRSTYVGMLEERLPYVLVYLPPWFRERYPEAFGNVRHNARRLTANYDLYETLKDLALRRYALGSHVTSSPRPGARGISIFQKIPSNRTCSEAGIPEHFCTCQDTREADPGDPALDLAASFLRATINQDLRPYPACVKFTEIRVLTGRVSRSNKQLSPKDTTSDVRSYLLQATLHPGNVAVEATLRYNPQPEVFQVTGEISRINQYGNQSHCMRHSVLRKFCYCKDQLRVEHGAMSTEKVNTTKEQGRPTAQAYSETQAAATMAARGSTMKGDVVEVKGTSGDEEGTKREGKTQNRR